MTWMSRTRTLARRGSFDVPQRCRVRLGKRRAQVIGEGGAPARASSAPLHPPQPLDLSPAEAHALELYQNEVEAWGWRFCLRGQPDQAAHGGGGPRPPAALTYAAVVAGVPLNATELQVRAPPAAETPQNVHACDRPPMCVMQCKIPCMLAA